MATRAGRAYSTPKNIELKGQGVGRGGILLFNGVNTTNPLGSSLNGLYINSSNELIYVSQGSTETLSGGGGGGVGSLDAAYSDGRIVTVDDGAIVLNDSTAGAVNVLTINKSGAGSGDVIEVIFSAAHTGRAINLDMTSAVAAVAMHIDNAAGARTGADIQVTANSTAAHSVIDINASGSGAVVGLDFQGSYNGSPAGQAILVTLDNADNLDTEIMQVDTGTGNRGVMFDLNFTHADSGTTSHIFDIDMNGVLDSNVFDFATNAACTGNVFFVDLDNGVAMTALRVEGSGTRTQPMIEISTDATGAASLVDIVLSGAISGHVLKIAMETTSTGDVMNVDMNNAVGGRFLFLDGGAAIRTANLVQVTNDGSGNVDVVEITDSNTGSGHVFDINTSGIGSGNVIDITYSAADTGDALKVVMANNLEGGALVITGAGVRTDSLIDVVSSETGSVDGMVLFSTSGVFTGNMLTISSAGAATTGALLHLDLDAGVAYKAINFDHAGARTAATMLATFDGTAGAAAGGTFLDANITMTGGGAAPFFDIDITGVYTGNIFDVLIGASAATGTMIKIDLGTTATASSAVNLVSGAMLRSTALVKIDDAGTSSGATFDINHTGVTTGIMFDIDATAATTGNVFDYATSAASTGTIFEVTLANAVGARLQNFTLSGTRTVNSTTIASSAAGAVDITQIDDSGTSSGHVWDVNMSGNSTGNVLDIVMSAGKVAGHALHVDLGTDIGGNALLVDAAGARTEPIIYIANTATDAGTDDHVLFINQTGLLDSNIVQLTFGTAASTGDALSIAMDTNVAGMGVTITSAGTGVSGEGNAINVAHTGALVAGADLMRLATTGSISATSNVLSVRQSTGAGSVGAFAVYISATGGNVEALKVDDGNVVFDENLTVTGTTLLTGAATATLGLQTSSTARTATADGLTTGIIAAGTGAVSVTSGNADHIITLPTAVVGNKIWVFAPATAFEVRTPAGSTATINNVNSDGTNEAAIPANTTSLFVCTGTDKWILMNWTNLGAVTTAIVPDAA
jgi:hypothetical protein